MPNDAIVGAVAHRCRLFFFDTTGRKKMKKKNLTLFSSFSFFLFFFLLLLAKTKKYDAASLLQQGRGIVVVVDVDVDAAMYCSFPSRWSREEARPGSAAAAAAEGDCRRRCRRCERRQRRHRNDTINIVAVERRSRGCFLRRERGQGGERIKHRK